MYKRLFGLTLALLLLLASCENVVTIEQPEEEASFSPSYLWASSRDVDGVLANVGRVRFNEIITPEIRMWQFNSEYASLSELFVPHTLRDGMELAYVNIYGIHSMNFIYHDEFGEKNLFTWLRTVPIEYAVESMFSRGAVAESIVEHNGITYGITEWDNPESGLDVIWASWEQHGQSFMMTFSSSFAMDEILDYCYVVPVFSWELQGDAVSASIQGMGEVSIFDGQGNEIIVIDSVLYRIGGDSIQVWRYS